MRVKMWTWAKVNSENSRSGLQWSGLSRWPAWSAACWPMSSGHRARQQCLNMTPGIKDNQGVIQGSKDSPAPTSTRRRVMLGNNSQRYTYDQMPDEHWIYINLKKFLTKNIFDWLMSVDGVGRGRTAPIPPPSSRQTSMEVILFFMFDLGRQQQQRRGKNGFP